ncbi:glutathione S-transferase Mu 1 [Trichonephila clavata]|uniref:glutathione transferase n=1 Tax=Trichonephila clavata TaxID=2740835 RepID=A0A8X6GUA7_TRICU|nr:glutathione S-transferase Mu 1 [Trichonephila clavata]
MAKPILGYWNVRGITEPIRYLLRYKKADFEEKRYVVGEDEWKKEKFNLGLEFPNLPYYIDGDMKLTQSVAILRYLARKHGLDGKTGEEKRRIALAEQQILDFRANLRKLAFSENYETDKDEFIKDLPKQYQLWEKFLGDRKYIAGDEITYVDFQVYEIFDFYRIFHPSTFESFPTLKTFHDRIKNLPEIKQYINSSAFRKWPLFGPMAKFGGSGDPPKHA